MESCVVSSVRRSRADRLSRDDSRAVTDSYRRRTPPGGQDRRNRAPRRSRSPPNIDRYQPDGRGPRDDHHRQRDDASRRRASPPPVQAGIDRYVPGHEAPSIANNPLQNPMAMDFQVGFTYFAEWWRVDQLIKDDKDRQKTGARRAERVKSEREAREDRAKEHDQIQAAYDAYKERLQVQMARSFVQSHKADEWFKERYIPQVRDEFRKRLGEFRRDAYNQWLRNLDEGGFDEFTLEGIYKSESNGAGGVVEKEEGEAPAANEVLGVGDLLPTRGGDLRDGAVDQPTLLIKTIAPTVSRVKMEAFCKENLGEGEGGFKWLSLSDPNPAKKFHRIGWVVLNPSTATAMNVDDRGDGHEEGEEEEGLANENGHPNQAVAAKAVAEINGKSIKDEERGDFTCHVGIHEAPGALRKKALWDLFSSPERVDRDLQFATRLTNKLDATLGDDFEGVAKINQQVEDLRAKGYLQAPISAFGQRERDFEEDEEGMIDEEEEGVIEDDLDDDELLEKKKRLDLLVEYLRRVHNFCLFCVFECDSVHELIRKCPGGHLRRPRSSLSSSAKIAAKASASGKSFPFKKVDKDDEPEKNSSPKPKSKLSIKTQQQLQRAFNWVKTYEEKLLQLLEPEKVDLKKLGGKAADEGIEEELRKAVKQEDENKWRCKITECSKLFKGHVFWRKHIEKRHPEYYDKVLGEVGLVNAYVLDPSHIAPSRSDSNSNGHFPMGNHNPSSTPRGFNILGNLQNMNQFSMNPAAAAAAAAALAQSTGVVPKLPGNAAMHMAALLAQVNPAATMAGAVDDGRTRGFGGGPMRRHQNNNRFGNRGPYDRPGGKDGRQARWNNAAGGNNVGNGGGRLTPPKPPGSTRGEGDAAATGATAGDAAQRNLRSYEDLDAAGGNGGGDLDY